MRSAFRTLGLVLLLLIAGTMANTQAPPEELHVALRLRQLSGEPLRDLDPQNLAFEAGSRTIPFVLASNSSQGLATRLLVLFPANPSQARIDSMLSTLDKLAPLYKKHWEIAVLTSQGHLSPWTVDAGEMRSYLRKPIAVPTTPAEALALLDSFPGRRVVIYAGDAAHPVPAFLPGAARQLNAMLYNVGGNIFSNYLNTGAQQAVPQLPFYGTPIPPQSGSYFVAGSEAFVPVMEEAVRAVKAERTLAGAIKDALNDEASYYDLILQVPRGTPSVTLRLRLAGGYQVDAQPYATGHQTPPTLVIAPPSR